MTNPTAILTNAGTAFAHLPADAQAAKVDELARRLVAQDVRYCVSSLVADLARDVHGMGEKYADELANIASREPDADDYREAAAYSETNELREVVVQADGDVWKWRSGPHDVWSVGNDSAVQAWREAFAELGQDDPDGTDCLEHWLVTDDLARRLRERGESVADDVSGLTIWGRCTSGQAIYADAVLQTIARDILNA